MNPTDKKQDSTEAGIGRRRFLNSAAAIGITTVGLAACQENTQGSGAPAASGPASGAAPAAKAQAGGAGSTDVHPGQLDTHYALWSSGHTGDARV